MYRVLWKGMIEECDLLWESVKASRKKWQTHFQSSLPFLSTKTYSPLVHLHLMAKMLSWGLLMPQVTNFYGCFLLIFLNILVAGSILWHQSTPFLGALHSAHTLYTGSCPIVYNRPSSVTYAYPIFSFPGHCLVKDLIIPWLNYCNTICQVSMPQLHPH